MNTQEGVADEDIRQEPDGNLSKNVFPYILDKQINTNGDEDEEIRNEDGSRVEYSCEFPSFLLFLFVANWVQCSDIFWACISRALFLIIIIVWDICEYQAEVTRAVGHIFCHICVEILHLKTQLPVFCDTEHLRAIEHLSRHELCPFTTDKLVTLPPFNTPARQLLVRLAHPLHPWLCLTPPSLVLPCQGEGLSSRATQVDALWSITRWDRWGSCLHIHM